MRARSIAVILSLLFLTWSAAAQVPWINVPVVSGNAGQYACVTRPTYNQAIAVITCNPAIVGQYPPFAQNFLFAHEHGHVYQIVFNPPMLLSPYVEYDADCYAAIYMVSNDPSSLAASIQWFRQVLGPYGGDAIHGNGFQMAARAEQCARAANPSFTAENYPLPQASDKLAVVNSFLPENSDPTKAAMSYPKPKGLSKTADVAFPKVQSDVQPTVCTAIEYMVEASHTAFWEASDETGAVAPNISKSLGASCFIGGTLRDRVVCSRALRADSKPDWTSALHSCLSDKEWTKKCEDNACSFETHTHPGDADAHVTVELTKGPAKEELRFIAPVRAAHEHDSPHYATVTLK